MALQTRWYSVTLMEALNYLGDDSRWFPTTFKFTLTGLLTTPLLIALFVCVSIPVFVTYWGPFLV